MVITLSINGIRNSLVRSLCQLSIVERFAYVVLHYILGNFYPICQLKNEFLYFCLYMWTINEIYLSIYMYLLKTAFFFEVAWLCEKMSVVMPQQFESDQRVTVRNTPQIERIMRSGFFATTV